MNTPKPVFPSITRLPLAHEGRRVFYAGPCFRPERGLLLYAKGCASDSCVTDKESLLIIL